MKPLDFKTIFETVDLNSLQNKRILITGATGMIGSGFFQLFLEMQIKLKFNLEIVTVSRSSLPKLNDQVQFTNKHYQLDLASASDLKELGNFDLIIHAAGSAQPSEFMSNKRDTYTIASHVTDSLLNLCMKDGDFIFLSSSDIYTGLIKDSYTESDIGTSNFLHPRSGYIEGKRAGEMFTYWSRLDGLHATSIRLSYTYGNTLIDGDSRVINEFVMQAIKYKEIRMRDSGSVIRTNLYIVDALGMILNAGLHGKFPIYNVAGNEMLSIVEIANQIGQITGAKVVLPESESEFNVHNNKFVRLDISRYTSEFGNPNFTSLKNGLIKYLS